MSPLDPILNSGLQDPELDAEANADEADWGTGFTGSSFILITSS